MFKNFNLFVAAPKTGDISDMSKSVAAPKDVKPTLIPMVRTAAEMPRQTGLLENLVAQMNKLNSTV